MRCVENSLKASQDLLVETLLNLGPAAKVLNDAVEFREANDLAIAVVTNVCYSSEEEEVMLTHRGERDVLLEDDRVLSHWKGGASGEVLRLKARAELLHIHLGDTVRSLSD